MLLEKHDNFRKEPEILDWRPYWAEIFNFKWPRLMLLVSFYLSLDCGSCQLERDLGQLARLSHAHCGAAQSDCSDLGRSLEIMLDGPQMEAELFERRVAEAPSVQLTHGICLPLSAPAPPKLLLTDTSRELCQMWVEFFGRRFHVYKTRADKGKAAGHRKGSEVSCVVGQKRTRDKLLSSGGVDNKLLGCSRTHFAVEKGRNVESHRLWNDSMAQFRKRSRDIRQKHLLIPTQIKQGGQIYSTGRGSLN